MLYFKLYVYVYHTVNSQESEFQYLVLPVPNTAPGTFVECLLCRIEFSDIFKGSSRNKSFIINQTQETVKSRYLQRGKMTECVNRQTCFPLYILSSQSFRFFLILTCITIQHGPRRHYNICLALCIDKILGIMEQLH